MRRCLKKTEEVTQVFDDLDAGGGDIKWGEHIELLHFFDALIFVTTSMPIGYLRRDYAEAITSSSDKSSSCCYTSVLLSQCFLAIRSLEQINGAKLFIWNLRCENSTPPKYFHLYHPIQFMECFFSP